jgi:DNA-binding CsgD family transcriptional regulator
LEHAKKQESQGLAAKTLTAQVKALVQLLQGFAVADARAAIWPALKKFAGHYGFDRLSVFQHVGAESFAGAAVLYSDVEAAVLDQYRRAGEPHLAVAHALRANEPIARSEMSEAVAHPKLYPVETLIVPVADGESGRGWAVLGGDAPDLSPLARSLVHVATETAFDRAQALTSPAAAQPSLLSPRETAILSWAAAGRTDSEIGKELGISARTVRFHTDNAKRKLRVATRIQAVTEALRLGLIKL